MATAFIRTIVLYFLIMIGLRLLGKRQIGELLAAAGVGEEIVTAALDFSVLAEVRNSINVFHDRRPELYRL